jgi:hypothetical protein
VLTVAQLRVLRRDRDRRVLSGYSAALAYAGRSTGAASASAALQVWRRAAAVRRHIVLFMFYAAQAAYVAERFSNPMYVEELNLSHLLESPHRTLLEALLLRFRPANMDVLPLYIVLLLALPAALLMLGRWHWVLAAGSVGLWMGAAGSAGRCRPGPTAAGGSSTRSAGSCCRLRDALRGRSARYIPSARATGSSTSRRPPTWRSRSTS